MTEQFESAIATLRPVALDELDRDVALQTRVDRKYVVDIADVIALVDRLGERLRGLEVDGRRRSSYESVYFDTETFDSYLGAAHHRPERFKVRTRRILEQDGCWIEVKRRARRGRNDKARRSHDPGRPTTLTAESARFLSGFDPVRPHLAQLRPAVRTRYRRTTLSVGDQRVTIDTDFAADDLQGNSVGVGDRLIVETKSSGRAGAADRALWQLGQRPVRVSKYAVAVASFHPELPHNRWHRTLDRWVTRG